MSDSMTRRTMLQHCAALFGGMAVSGSTLPRGAACLEGARIRWIVGWTPGGGFDTYSRLAEPFIERALQAQIAIDNVPGAGGRVGALTIARARPDGRTLGILNGSGFLWNRNPGARSEPDLSRDFTVLARVSRRQQIVIAGPSSGLRTIDDIVALSRRRAIVAGVTAPDSSNFASLAAVTNLMGVRTEFVTGYPGSREVMLGLLRGDFDLTSMDIESYIEVPDMEQARPLLQITPEQSPDARMAGVPHLAGPDGLMSTRTDLFPGDQQRAAQLSAAIVAYLEFGRLFAGPGAMAPALRDCVEQGILAALSDPGFTEAARRAGRSVDIGTGAAVRRSIPAVVEAVRPIAGATADAIRRIR